ncbi:uncharacterized protein BJX67DRAFT_283330 [Aspergillus lucknowensis]|uniref:Uncharacterized protein n=1 Tax=Aspergillus lucknowensis TaxID=176173 RepID=A0ABR4M0W9_9EURO
MPLCIIRLPNVHNFIPVSRPNRVLIYFEEGCRSLNFLFSDTMNIAQSAEFSRSDECRNFSRIGETVCSHRLALLKDLSPTARFSPGFASHEPAACSVRSSRRMDPGVVLRVVNPRSRERYLAQLLRVSASHRMRSFARLGEDRTIIHAPRNPTPRDKNALFQRGQIVVWGTSIGVASRSLLPRCRDLTYIFPLAHRGLDLISISFFIPHLHPPVTQVLMRA